jgi:hypothetical protein
MGSVGRRAWLAESASTRRLASLVLDGCPCDSGHRRPVQYLGTRKLKERLTFPVGGYVTFPDPTRSQRVLAVVLAMVVSAGVSALVVSRREMPSLGDLAAPACGLLIAFASLIPALRWRLPHYLIVSTTSLALSLWVLWTRPGPENGMILLFLGLGTVTVIVGAVRLGRFLHHHPQCTEI